MNGQPGTFTEEDGKRSFTRVSGAIGLVVVLCVFIWTAYCAGKSVDAAASTSLWQIVLAMFNAVLIFVGILYGTNKAPAIAQAVKGQTQPAPGQPSVAPQP